MGEYVVAHNCKRPAIANMDHRLDSRPMVNRACITCLTHWYGDAETAVFEMPRKVWDGWMEAAVHCPETEDTTITITAKCQSPTPPDPTPQEVPDGGR